MQHTVWHCCQPCAGLGTQRGMASPYSCCLQPSPALSWHPFLSALGAEASARCHSVPGTLQRAQGFVSMPHPEQKPFICSCLGPGDLGAGAAGAHGAGAGRDGWTSELQDLLPSQVLKSEKLILKVAAMLHHLAEPLAFPLLPCSQSSDIPRALGALAAPPDWAPPPCGRAAVMGS